MLSLAAAKDGLKKLPAGGKMTTEEWTVGGNRLRGHEFFLMRSFAKKTVDDRQRDRETDGWMDRWTCNRQIDR